MGYYISWMGIQYDLHLGVTYRMLRFYKSLINHYTSVVIIT